MLLYFKNTLFSYKTFATTIADTASPNCPRPTQKVLKWSDHLPLFKGTLRPGSTNHTLVNVKVCKQQRFLRQMTSHISFNTFTNQVGIPSWLHPKRLLWVVQTVALPDPEVLADPKFRLTWASFADHSKGIRFDNYDKYVFHLIILESLMV